MKKHLSVIFILSFIVLVHSTVVVYGILDEPKALNVWVDYGPHAITWSKYVFSHKYRSLYRFSHISFKFVPDLAKELPTVSREGSLVVYKITLRNGIYWSDGSPITAYDVEFTLNSALELVKEHNLGGNWYVMVDPEFFYRAEAISSRELKIYFKKKGFLRVEYGTLMAPIIQRKYWKRHVDVVISGKKDINYLYGVDTVKDPDPASGPFVLEKWEKGAFIRLKSVENYYDYGYTEIHYENGAIVLRKGEEYFWQSKNPAGRVVLKVEMGPFVDGVLYRVYTDKSSAVQALANGEIDMILSPNGLTEGDIRELAKSPDVRVVASPGLNLRYLGFNLRRFPANSKAFRKAMAYVINMDYLKERIFKNSVILSDSVIPPTNPRWHNPNVYMVDHSLSLLQRLEKAYEILKEAGFKWKTAPKFSKDVIIRKGEGFISPSGAPIKEIVLLAPTQSYDPTRATIAFYIEKWANYIGIPLKVYYMDFKALIGKVWY